MCMRERKRVSDIYNIKIEVEQVRVLRAGKSLTGLARAIEGEMQRACMGTERKRDRGSNSHIGVERELELERKRFTEGDVMCV